MHICHVTSMHAWYDDRIYERACRTLARMGHRVTLIAAKDSEEELHGVRVQPLPERSGWRRRVFGSRDAARLAAETGADIIQFHDPDLLPWMRALALRGHRVVYDIHENFRARFSMWGLPGPVAELCGAVFRGYERACTDEFAGIVAVSQGLLDLFSGHFKAGLVVQNVPDTERFPDLAPPEERTGPPLIYTSGTHSDERNCLQTVQAMPAVLERHPHARFVFAGRYSPEGYEETLRAEARRLGTEANLDLEGALPWEENFKRTMKAHVGLTFYADNPNNRIGIPNRLFEYMLCGSAVLGHDFPELRRIVDGTRCGSTVDSRDPQAIAAALVALLDDPDELADAGRRGRRSVLERYNFRSQCEEMVGLYEGILGAARARD